MVGDDNADEADGRSVLTARDPEKELSELQIRAYSALVEDGTKLASKIQSVEHFCLSMGIEPRPQFVVVLSRSCAIYCKGGGDERAWTDQYSKIHPDCFNSEAGGLNGLNQTEHQLGLFMRECLLPFATRTHALVVVEEGDSDSLGRVWGNVCATERERSANGKLPFNVLSITSKVRYAITEQIPGSIPHQFYAQSNRWRKSSKAVNEALRGSEEHPSKGHMSNWFEMHPTRGATHYIVLDGVDEKGNIDYHPWVELTAKIVQQLALDITSLAIMTMHTMWGLNASLHFGANYVGRNIPLLLLDTRRWPAGEAKPKTIDDAHANLLKLEKRLNDHGTTNFYWNSTLAYIHGTVRRQLHISTTTHGGDQKGRAIWYVLHQLRRKDELEIGDGTTLYDDGSAAVKRGIAKSTVAPSEVEAADASELEPDLEPKTEAWGGAQEGINAREESALQLCSRAAETLGILEDEHVENVARLQQEFERKRFAAVLATFEAAREAASPLKRLDDLVKEQSREWMGMGWYLNNARTRIYNDLPNEFPELFVANDVLFKRTGKLHGKMRCAGGEIGLSLTNFDDPADALARYDKTLEALRAKIGEWSDLKWTPGGALCAHIVENDAGIKKIFRSSYDFLNAIKLLESPLTYSANLADLDGLNKVMARAARINRLPDHNRLQTMELLKAAWEKVDVFSRQAQSYRVFARAVYFCMLLAALLTTIVTTTSLVTTSGEAGWALEPEQMRAVVMASSVVLVIFTAVQSLFQPGVRWTQLRGAALTLESEIWRFRTRTGVCSYGGHDAADEDSHAAEQALEAHIEQLSQHVMKSATMAETSLLSNFDGLFMSPATARKAKKYRHGQHPRARVDGTFGQSNQHHDRNKELLVDDHHSPLLPDEYLRARVQPQLLYYQRQLPKHERNRILFEVLLNATTIAGLVLAFFNEAQWGALPAAFATVVIAWSKFVSTDTKLQRYADAISSIDSILRWWRLLGSVEKANLTKVSNLINACESTFQTERQGWVATSMAAHALADGKKSDDDEGNQTSTNRNNAELPVVE